MASSNVIEGYAYVVDGDTLYIGNKKIRLYGIDAPEKNQTCSKMKVGQGSKQYLMNVTEDQFLSCTVENKDRYGRHVAICFIDGRDIGAELVQQGYAFSYDYFSIRYKNLEAEAKSYNRGIHKFNCQAPYKYRSGLKFKNRS